MIHLFIYNIFILQNHTNSIEINTSINFVIKITNETYAMCGQSIGLTATITNDHTDNETSISNNRYQIPLQLICSG